MRISLVLLAACGGSTDPGGPPLLDASPFDAPYKDTAFGEQCGNGVDDDSDGLTDEDCAPARFAGVFAPEVAADPALIAIETQTGLPLSLLQTYHSTSPAGVAKIADDLHAIFERGQVAHLNLEPSGYTEAQYADSTQLAGDFAGMGAAIGDALHGNHGRVLLTFGAEMNGNWTDWGCLPAVQYIAMYRLAHASVDTGLRASGVDPRRVRWAYGPNATASANCGSAAGYYPGADVVDFLGMSAYRMDGTTVAQSVTDPMKALYAATGATQRFIVLQTGARAAGDRDAWIHELYAVDDARIAGIIWFDAADWAAPATSLAPIGALPAADRQLDGLFAPRFTDVAYGDDGFWEIDALAAAKITSGCGGGTFCPDALLKRTDANALLTNAFQKPIDVGSGDAMTETELADAIAAQGGYPVSGSDAMVTRARAAVLIAHGARLSHPAPF